MLFNLDFAKSTISSCFFFYFLVIDIYFLIPAVMAQIFNTTAELVFPITMPTKLQKQKWEHIQ